MRMRRTMFFVSPLPKAKSFCSVARWDYGNQHETVKAPIRAAKKQRTRRRVATKATYPCSPRRTDVVVYRTRVVLPLRHGIRLVVGKILHHAELFLRRRQPHLRREQELDAREQFVDVGGVREAVDVGREKLRHDVCAVRRRHLEGSRKGKQYFKVARPVIADGDGLDVKLVDAERSGDCAQRHEFVGGVVALCLVRLVERKGHDGVPNLVVFHEVPTRREVNSQEQWSVYP